MEPLTLFTIGHSNRSLNDFLERLTGNGISALVDVRARPASRRFPHFNQIELRSALEKSGITYHFAGRQLGGRRKGSSNTPHRALQEEQLRAYADYMMTEDFKKAITQLINLAGHGHTAILCAEKDPNFCHRSLIADYLVLQGMTVMHIIDADVQEHHLRPEARRESAELVYDNSTTAQLEFN